jgi:hypothetical protein
MPKVPIPASRATVCTPRTAAGDAAHAAAGSSDRSMHRQGRAPAKILVEQLGFRRDDGFYVRLPPREVGLLTPGRSVQPAGCYQSENVLRPRAAAPDGQPELETPGPARLCVFLAHDVLRGLTAAISGGPGAGANGEGSAAMSFERERWPLRLARGARVFSGLVQRDTASRSSEAMSQAASRQLYRW